MFQRFLDGTSGHKTYFVAGLLVLWGVLGLALGKLDQASAGEAILAGLALIGIGHKLDKAAK